MTRLLSRIIGALWIILSQQASSPQHLDFSIVSCIVLLRNKVFLSQYPINVNSRGYNHDTVRKLHSGFHESEGILLLLWSGPLSLHAFLVP